MEIKKHISALGFKAKENTSDIFIKKYASNYTIEIDLKKECINYGNKIKAESKSTQNFSQPENFVVLECVNRLLETGYRPQHIILEKTWAAGHGTSGRLDICVTRPDGSEYLLIECKTYGKEYDKAAIRLKKDGGQLFTYFKFSNKADVIILYASELKGKEVIYKNEIITIEDDYRKGDVNDFYKNWNKVTLDNGVWENEPYNIKSKKTFVKKDLKPLTEEISKSIFHSFASILRKHSVSDKPNAFNKIFNLFLAKLYDEAKREDDELEFHWRDNDNPVDFQIRLIDLHKKGLFDFLAKEIEGIDDSDFQAKTAEQIFEKKKKYLKFNNVFAIKDVLNDADFDENQRVLKDVVQLLEKYQIRYPRKQQHLSDFFEQLLTTGLKQEVGQYFTPPPVTKFIIRSLPLPKLIEQELNSETPKLPAIIDYAAGSGHFITEALEEYQEIINNIDTKKFFPKAIKAVKGWIEDPYEWAAKYVYGIEKDYRLVKVAKVGCYFYGDGVAQIIHGDGLDSFATSKTYKGLLKDNINIEDSSKAKFSVVVSNPPYAVNDCKDDLEYIGAQNEYTLYNSLSDKSKDIECLFVERTKHLLKDGGVASLILPSSILNNTGIQTKTREIILKYFDIVAIAEFGSNTFMATGTNTVTLFLKRRSNKLSAEWEKSVATIFETHNDLTVNGIDKPVAKYVAHVWENVSYKDYITLLQQKPNKAIEQHELYSEYRKKLKTKNEKEFWSLLLEREADKLLYFIITLNQQVVLVKSGEKENEKRFLGYEFSSRRGGEGMHAMQRGKTIDECTHMYNTHDLIDKTKASTYIYQAFAGNYKMPIDASMQSYVSRHDLVDMLTFDRVEFEKTISLSVKKKVKIESKWEIKKLGEASLIEYGTRIVKQSAQGTIYPVYGGGGETFKTNSSNRKDCYIISRFGMSPQCMRFVNGDFFLNDSGLTVSSSNSKILNQDYLNYYLFTNQEMIYLCGRGVAQKNLDIEAFNAIQIPLPPLNIQQKIVTEIEALEAKKQKAKEEVEKLKKEIVGKANVLNSKIKSQKLGQLCEAPLYGANESATDGNPLTDYRYIRITDINEDGTLNNNWKTAEKIENKYILKENDFLFARSGATAGKTFLYQEKYGKALYAGYLIKFETKKDKLLTQFLNFIIKGDKYQNWVVEKRVGTAQPNINAQEYSSFEIPLPSLSEQKKIVSEIEKIETKISVLEKQLAELPNLKEAVLQKYL